MSDIEIIKNYGSIENYIYELEQENQQLKGKLDNNTKIYLNTSKYASECEGKMVTYKYERDLYKSVIEEAREYLTSYSSIHTIQFGTEEDSPNDIESNKTLDNKTITEMTHRYLKVHDKLLQILDKVKEN